MSEVVKKINEWAYAAGRSYQSQETGFLHLSYQLPEDQSAHSIPILENTLFALSLLRLKTQESVLEAKDLLDKILHFQVPSGNFPVYLHEYPVCHNHFIGADLLPVFHWILRHFGHVLGEQLKQRIQMASKKLIEFNQDKLQQCNPSTIIKLKLAAASNQTMAVDEELFWHIPEQLGEALIAMQMMGLLPVAKLRKMWHSNLHCYTGPSVKEYHRTARKDLTLYDFYMYAFTQTLPEIPKPHFSHLKAALIQPEESLAQGQEYPHFQEGQEAGVNFSVLQDKPYAISTVELKDHLLSKGFHPFYFTWDRHNTLVMQGGNVASMNVEWKEKCLCLYIELKPIFDTDEREASKEICFYTEVDPHSSLFVDEQKSTTFLLNQKISVRHPKMKSNLTFSLENGEGDFKGHIMRANRPSQKATADRFAAYDWQIALRTLRRSEACRIKVTFDYSVDEI